MAGRTPAEPVVGHQDPVSARLGPRPWDTSPGHRLESGEGRSVAAHRRHSGRGSGPDQDRDARPSERRLRPSAQRLGGDRVRLGSASRRGVGVVVVIGRPRWGSGGRLPIAGMGRQAAGHQAHQDQPDPDVGDASDYHPQTCGKVERSTRPNRSGSEPTPPPHSKSSTSCWQPSTTTTTRNGNTAALGKATPAHVHQTDPKAGAADRPLPTENGSAPAESLSTEPSGHDPGESPWDKPMPAPRSPPSSTATRPTSSPETPSSDTSPSTPPDNTNP